MPLRSAVFFFFTLLSAAAGWADDHLGNPNIQSWTKGVLEYRKLSTGDVTGSEEFRLTVHPDGRRTIQTTNRLDNYETRRDIVMRIAADFRPEEVFASYWNEGTWTGSGLFTLRDNRMHAFVNTPMGTLEQNIGVPENFSFVPHPLSTNAFHHWNYDHDKGGKQTVHLYDMPPRAPATASLIGTLIESTIEYVGRRTVTTEAGTFETDLYLYGGNDFEMYVTPDHSMLVKALWQRADAEYVLVKVESGS